MKNLYQWCHIQWQIYQSFTLLIALLITTHHIFVQFIPDIL